MASFRLDLGETFAAASSNPKAWRDLAQPVPGPRDYDRVILLVVAALLLGAAAVLGMQAVLLH